MTITYDVDQLPCARKPEAYLDESLSVLPTPAEVDSGEWERISHQMHTIQRECAACPALIDCLYRAVVEVDVFGYAACTTHRDRQRIREMLGLDPSLSPVDPVGVRTGRGPVDHETVLAVRRAHPDDTFAQLAERLGCSLSTVKRHMRRAREESATRAPRRLPTVDEVLDCFDRVVEPL